MIFLLTPTYAQKCVQKVILLMFEQWLKITIRKNALQKPLPDVDNESLKPLTGCLRQNILQRNQNNSETVHF